MLKCLPGLAALMIVLLGSANLRAAEVVASASPGCTSCCAASCFKPTCYSCSMPRFPCLGRLADWACYRPLDNSRCYQCKQATPCCIPPLYLFFLNSCSGKGVERVKGPDCGFYFKDKCDGCGTCNKCGIKYMNGACSRCGTCTTCTK